MNRITALLISILMAVAILPTTMITASAKSGKCGDDVFWELDTSTGELTISGTGKMYDYDEGASPFYQYRNSIKSINIKSSVTNIGDFAFLCCTNLINVDISDSVTSIGNWAFEYCQNLKTIIIPDNVKNIGNYAFDDCYGLKNIVLSDTLKTIGNYAFGGCSMTSITIPDSVTTIGEGAFCKCTSLTSISIPDGVTSIGWNTFRGCTSLMSIDIPNSVTSIEGQVFEGCSNLMQITIPNSMTAIGNYAFSDCYNLTSITIPGSVTYIGQCAFEYCMNLADIYCAAKSQPDEWNDDWLEDCNAIVHWGENGVGDGWKNNWSDYVDIDTIIIYPVEGGNLYFGQESWWSNEEKTSEICLLSADSQVTEVNIPSRVNGLSVTSVMGFGSGENITNIYIPKTVTSSYDFAFYNLNNLKNITVEQGNSRFYSVDGVLYSKDSMHKSIIIYPVGRTETTYAIQDDTTYICYAAFEAESNLKSISIPNSVKWIDYDAFYGCTNLTDVYYTGTEEQWNATTVKSGNEVLDNATIYFNSDLFGENSGNDNQPGSSIGLTAEEFIDKHIEYANSDRYKDQIVPGFTGALNDALEDIKNNGMISSYNTLDSINTILGFDLDLSDVEEYELLLAQILFSRAGVDSIDEIYDEYLQKNVLTICDLLIDKVLPKMTSSAVQENLKHLEELRDTLKGLAHGDDGYIDVLNQIMNSLNNLVDFNDSNVLTACSDACKSAGLSFASDFLSNELGTASDTIYQVIVGMAAAEAYRDTSDAFGDMLLNMRKNIAIHSDDPRFSPYTMVGGICVTEETIWRLLGLENADSPIGPDPLNTPVKLSALATAIENFYTEIEDAKASNAVVIAQNALVAFSEETMDNLVDAELNVVVSLLECLPVVNQFSIIRDMFNGTQFVIDTFTMIDDRAYLGTTVMRLYAIAYIHYYTVNALSNTDNWGFKGAFLVQANFSKEEQLADAIRFDEAVSVYRAILTIAASYAEEYYATHYETIEAILSKIPNRNPLMPPYIDVESDAYKSIKVKIIELQMQKNDLAYEWCHSARSIFDQLHNIKTYDSSDLLVYSFKCPASVTFKNEFGEIVAVLSNGDGEILPGYEQYFYISEVISGSGEYVNIAAVPKSYTVTIEGTGAGQMDVSVSEYFDGRIGETTQYFDIPILENCNGYFKPDAGADMGFRLVMEDNMAAHSQLTNISNDEEVGSIGVILVVVCIAVGVLVTVVVLVNCKKKHP